MSKQLYMLTGDSISHGGGEYFVRLFKGKPSIQQIIDSIWIVDAEETTPEQSEHIHKGGGRQGDEYSWYHLRQVTAELAKKD